MGKLGAIFLCGLLIGTAQAEGDALCKQLSETAHSIMKNRQAGALMSKMMDIETDEAIKPVMHMYIVQAYEQPRMRAPKNQKQAAIDFANDAYLACITAKKPKAKVTTK